MWKRNIIAIKGILSQVISYSTHHNHKKRWYVHWGYRDNISLSIHDIEICMNRMIEWTHVANMAPTWVLSAPDMPHVDPMNLAFMDGLIGAKAEAWWSATLVMAFLLLHLIDNTSFQWLLSNNIVVPPDSLHYDGHRPGPLIHRGRHKIVAISQKIFLYSFFITILLISS